MTTNALSALHQLEIIVGVQFSPTSSSLLARVLDHLASRFEPIPIAAPTREELKPIATIGDRLLGLLVFECFVYLPRAKAIKLDKKGKSNNHLAESGRRLLAKCLWPLTRHNKFCGDQP